MRTAAVELMHLLRRRPNARTLVLESMVSDLAELHAEIVNAFIKFYAPHSETCLAVYGQTASCQILTIDVDTYQRDKLKLGPVDAVIVDNRHNVFRVDKSKKYKSIEVAIHKRYPSAEWIIVEPEMAPLGIPKLPPPVWFCGEPLYVKTRPFPFGMMAEDIGPCRGENPNYARYCRHCGRFRGLTYAR